MRKLLFLVCGLGLLLVMFTALPLSAQAASHRTMTPLVDACSAHPSDANCDGVPPDQTNCPADAIALNTTNIVSGTTVVGQIVLRYSPTCQSAWAHTISSIGTANLFAQIRRADGLLYSKSTVGTGVRSPMVFVNFQAVRACGSVNAPSACAPNS